jgi:hypothetical protein
MSFGQAFTDQSPGELGKQFSERTRRFGEQLTQAEIISAQAKAENVGNFINTFFSAGAGFVVGGLPGAVAGASIAKRGKTDPIGSALGGASIGGLTKNVTGAFKPPAEIAGPALPSQIPASGTTGPPIPVLPQGGIQPAKGSLTGSFTNALKSLAENPQKTALLLKGIQNPEELPDLLNEIFLSEAKEEKEKRAIEKETREEARAERKLGLEERKVVVTEEKAKAEKTSATSKATFTKLIGRAKTPKDISKLQSDLDLNKSLSPTDRQAMNKNIISRRDKIIAANKKVNKEQANDLIDTLAVMNTSLIRLKESPEKVEDEALVKQLQELKALQNKTREEFPDVSPKDRGSLEKTLSQLIVKLESEISFRDTAKAKKERSLPQRIKRIAARFR